MVIIKFNNEQISPLDDKAEKYLNQDINSIDIISVGQTPMPKVAINQITDYLFKAVQKCTGPILFNNRAVPKETIFRLNVF